MTVTAAKLPSPFRGGRSASSFILFCTDLGEYRESVRHSPSVGFADSSLPEGAIYTLKLESMCIECTWFAFISDFLRGRLWRSVI